MTRPNRVFFAGAVYHVYNRLARGERVFDRDPERLRFRDLLQEVAQRDELTVFAWCLMGNHYHLAVRTSAVPLHRPLRSLQRGVTRTVNGRRGVFGPLWQGRYRAKLVVEERYLEQLLAYIHLNPVTAGMCADPALYRWSGHSEILGRVRGPIVAVDEVLALFGTTRRSARAAYVRTLRGAASQPWIGEGPGHLPWWRLGRRPQEEDEDPARAVELKQARERPAGLDRPSLSVASYLARGASVLRITMEDLRGRLRGGEVVRAREALAVVGVERYGLKVKELAWAMAKSPDSITKAIVRTTHRRATVPALRAWLDRLDQRIASASPVHDTDNGGTA